MGLNENAGRHALLVAWLASAAVGCAESSETASAQTTPSGNVEIFSWWTSLWLGTRGGARNPVSGRPIPQFPKPASGERAEERSLLSLSPLSCPLIP
jgi:hypothetical protein